MDNNTYLVGSPFHFEMEMDVDPELNQIVRLLNGGKPDLISVDGTVVFNQEEFAVVKVSSRFLEFDGVVHSLAETQARFPGFKPSYVPDQLDEYIWIDSSVEGFNGFIPNHEFYEINDQNDIEDTIEGARLPRRIILHPTTHPQIVFAGGNILGRKMLSLVDGLIIFTGGFTGLQGLANAYEQEGRIPCPHKIYNDAGGRLRQMIQEDLDNLTGQGCKTIGIHAPNSVNEAKEAIETTVEWIEKHPDTLETVYFVDLRDDYFHCFGTKI